MHIDDRRARGKAARAVAPRSVHGQWQPSPSRQEAVASLEEQNADRLVDLVPLRRGRMLASPFAFYRGAAKLMADDLAASPNTRLHVQLCGDAHLSNFGVFATPERNLIFDLNDFDETLRGPFEYDVKRLAASFTIAARHVGLRPDQCDAVAQHSVTSYRTAMAQFAEMGVLDTWYAAASDETILAALKQAAGPAAERKQVIRAVTQTFDKARTRTSLSALAKLSESVDGTARIISQPPVVVPLRELPGFGGSAEQSLALVVRQLAAYRKSLQGDRRLLMEQFEYVDSARKVVGVGSVGTRAFIVLLQGRDGNDPLFLQIKQANPSVLERHLTRSKFSTNGQRVVEGQRAMQAASDIFLGWTTDQEHGRHFYWRQLRDMKGSFDVTPATTSAGLARYADLCGWTLARAHARSGDPVAIKAYLGASDRFDRSIVAFAATYADQNERDFATFSDAVASGTLEATQGVSPFNEAGSSR